MTYKFQFIELRRFWRSEMLLLFYCKERRNLMQEEVEQKTMALSVRTTRLTAELLQKAFRHFLEAQKNLFRAFLWLQKAMETRGD